MCYAARPFALIGVLRSTNAKKTMSTEGGGAKVIICATFLSIYRQFFFNVLYIYSLSRKIKFYVSKGGFHFMKENHMLLTSYCHCSEKGVMLKRYNQRPPIELEMSLFLL